MQSELLATYESSGGVAAAWEPGPLLFRTLNTDASGACETRGASPTADEVPLLDLPMVIEAAREEGRREAAAQLEAEMERRVEAERGKFLFAVDAFGAEKRRYFLGLEKEVVRLSLAIAERVLHRETQMDPTLLAGAARVVLEQVDQDSGAALLVAPGDMARWRIAAGTLDHKLEVREESSLRDGECLLQTEAGTFELGMRSQLCEIERGFFELLGRGAALVA